MSSEKKFSRITVTSDDEDDVVIHAGVRSAAFEAEEECAEAVETACVEPAEALGAEGDMPAEPEVEPASELRPAAEPDPAAASARKAKPARDEYCETTLEDLEVGKMSGMQKGIIVAAVVLIAVFVVYLLV